VFPGSTIDDLNDVFVNNGNPINLIPLNGSLFFSADSDSGRELWKSDGTADGTVLVKDIRPGSSSADVGNLTNVNGLLFFNATDASGQGLWKSDGTAAGTTLVHGHSAPGSLTNLNGTLIFVDHGDGISGFELWKSDGSEAGTVLVKDILPGSGGSAPSHLTVANGNLFFTANDTIHGSELWKSDGTEAGTVLVKDVNVGAGSSNPLGANIFTTEPPLTVVDGTVFFSADDGVHGRELWQSDGTAAGTFLIQDIFPGISGSGPLGETNVNGRLYFSAKDGVNGYNPWVLANEPVILAVDTNTLNTDLQVAVADVLSATTGTGAAPSPVVLTVGQSELSAVVDAVEGLSPNVSGTAITVVVNLADGDYSGQTIAVPAGIRLVIDGAGGNITFEGHSPAFTVVSGDVRLTGLTFVNSTDASTILVSGGSVIIRDSVISETTGGTRAAIEVTGGAANLGTPTALGGNTFLLNGPGEFVRNTTANSIPAYGNVFQREANTIATDIEIGPQQRLIFDESSGELALTSTVVTVDIDLRPASLNIDQNGAISLVIFGSSLFDVSQVNTASLKLAGVAIDVFNHTLVDDNKDGTNDLSLTFRTSDALKAALTAIYSDLLLEDAADDGSYAAKQNALISLDGAFGEFGQEFSGSDSAKLFLAGNSLRTLLTSLGIS
jgi:ELWxxDGT repeat protein